MGKKTTKRKKEKKKPPGLKATLRRSLITGILILLPLIVTVLLFAFLFFQINQYLTPMAMKLLKFTGLPLNQLGVIKFLAPIVGVLLTLGVIILVGILGRNYIGKKVGAVIDGIIMRIPLVKGIYGASKKLLDAFNPSFSGSFSKVVLVEYPRKGSYTIGFLTAEVTEEPKGGLTCDMVYVFLPTTPNPTSGWLLLFPRSDVTPLDISIEDAIKIIVSGGIVPPAKRKEIDRPTMPRLKEKD
jgi:uncharacterized membrane protein